MPVGPFRRLISRGPGVRGDVVRVGHINTIYEALETMPAFADLQSPVSIVGTGPLASRPASASEGDGYIAVDGGVSTVYIWSDGAWVDGGTLQGPEGPKGDTGAQGARGEKGDTGDTGPAGDPGEGVPVGGATGQVLAKASGADLDAAWVDPSEGIGAREHEFSGDPDDEALAYERVFADGKRTFHGMRTDGSPSTWATELISGAMTREGAWPGDTRAHTFDADPDEESRIAYARVFANGRVTFDAINPYGRPVPFASNLIADALTRDGLRVASVQGKTGAVRLRTDELDAGLLAPTVRTPTSWGTYPTDALGALLKGVHTNAAKYNLTVLYPTDYPGSGRIEHFDGSPTESAIRPLATLAAAIAGGIACGVYDASAIGVSVADAKAMAIRLLDPIARLHVANNADAGVMGVNNPYGYWSGTLEEPPTLAGAFGRIWQSASWATTATRAAWLLWADLDDTLREQVCRMIQHEADRMLRYRVEYQYTLAGADITGGDSKTEEVSWNLGAIAQALLMMPHHPRADVWTAKLVEMGFCAGSVLDDLADPVLRNGVLLADITGGANTPNDFVVINHGIRNPRYQNNPGSNIPMWAYAALRLDIPYAAVHHGRERWRVYSTYTFGSPAKTMYEPGSGLINYPDGNDNGSHIHTLRYALSDIQSSQLGWDDGLPTSAITWAQYHIQDTADMQARFTDGHTYLDSSEDEFYNAEQGVFSSAAHCAQLLAAGAAPVSNVPVPLLTSRNLRRWRNQA